MKCSLRALVLGLLLSAVAAAQEDTAVTTARELGSQGLDAYDAGRYDEAVDKLSRAYAVVKLPTVAVYTARALVKVGKLVEASEVYLQATRLEASGEFRAEQQQAQQDADQERSTLMPRIPTLVVKIKGADAKAVTASVDGKVIPMALLGGGYLVNPGMRKVEAKFEGRSATEDVRLGEGERKSVTLEFGAATTPASAERATSAQKTRAPAPQARTATSPVTEPEVDRPAARGVQRTAGWVALGVGGAGLVVWTVGALAANAKKSKLEDNGCVDHHCYADQSDDIDSYHSLRTLSAVGFIVGAVGAGAGITLLLTAPKSSGPELTGWVGPGMVGLQGRL